MNTQKITLWHKQNWHTVSLLPDKTLLDTLRDDLGLSSVKEACASGDCGACTVLIGRCGQDAIRPVNSCLKLAHSVDQCAVYTADSLQFKDHFHPLVKAMQAIHASQCGFCSPGMLMSLLALLQTTPPEDWHHERLTEALSGNLCRCTGYMPFFKIAKELQNSFTQDIPNHLPWDAQGRLKPIFSPPNLPNSDPQPHCFPSTSSANTHNQGVAATPPKANRP